MVSNGMDTQYNLGPMNEMFTGAVDVALLRVADYTERFGNSGVQ